MKKVVVIGYMGSGKSVIAKKLASELDSKCFELDELIEQNEKKSIKEIFETKGELYFRKLEHQLFESILNDDDFVLSTGGGTPCYYDNHKILSNQTITSIYLKASIETLYNRLKDEKSTRPLLSELDSSEMKEFIAKHLFERSYFYNQAKYVVNVDDKSIEEIVSEIKQLLL